MMLLGCILPLLMIFLLPAMGVEGGWIIWVAIGLMLGCHLIHLVGHKHVNHDNHDQES